MFQQETAIGGRVIACIQSVNHLQCRIVLGQHAIGIAQQIRQSLRTVDIAGIQVQLQGFIVGTQIGCRHLVAFFATFAWKVAFALELVRFAVGNQPALVNIDYQPADSVSCPRLAHQHLKLNVAQLLHILRAYARQIAVDLRLVWKTFQPQITGRCSLRLQRFVDGFGISAAHHQPGNHCLCLIDQAVFDFLHRDFQPADQQAIQSNFSPILKHHHQKCRDRFVVPFCRLICYGFHRMASWVVSVGTKNLSQRGHSFTFAQNFVAHVSKVCE
jgi:hypothetical protein